MTRVNARELLMLRAAGPQAIQLLAIEAALGVRRDAEGRPQGGKGRQGDHLGLLSRLGGSLRQISAGFVRARRRNRAIAELSRLDDRLLNDVGIERGCIVETVDATMERRAPAWTVVELGRSLVEPLFRPILRWRRDAETLGALGQLDDHLLTDIGVSRGDLAYQPELVLNRARAANANRAPLRAA